MANSSKLWSYEQQRFMAWLCTPDKNRKPKTQIALAKDMGLSSGTLSVWKRDPEFIKAVQKMMFTATKEFWGRIPEYLQAIMTHAIEGKAHYAIVVKDIIMGSNQFAHLFKPENIDVDNNPNKMTKEEMVDEVMETFRLKNKSGGKKFTVVQEAALN